MWLAALRGSLALAFGACELPVFSLCADKHARSMPRREGLQDQEVYNCAREGPAGGPGQRCPLVLPARLGSRAFHARVACWRSGRMAARRWA
jgi:hypothetical protein